MLIHHSIEGGRDRLGTHHHPTAAAIWLIIDLLVIAETERAQRMRFDDNDALLDSAPDHTAAKWRIEHLGKKRDYVEFHRRRARCAIASTLQARRSLNREAAQDSARRNGRWGARWGIFSRIGNTSPARGRPRSAGPRESGCWS